MVSELERTFPHYRRRHLIKPGVTGWAQVRCGYAGSTLGTAWKLCHDLYYLKRRSRLVNLMIVLETLVIAGLDSHRPLRAPSSQFLFGMDLGIDLSEDAAGRCRPSSPIASRPPPDRRASAGRGAVALDDRAVVDAGRQGPESVAPVALEPARAEGVGDRGVAVADQQRGLQRQRHPLDQPARAELHVVGVPEVLGQRAAEAVEARLGAGARPRPRRRRPAWRRGS